MNRGDLGGPLVVEPLLLLQRGLRQVHQRRGVHVDVVEPGPDLLGNELLHLADLASGVDWYFLWFTWQWSPWMKSGRV